MTTDNLNIFGVTYTGVTGIKASDTNGNTLVYIRKPEHQALTVTPTENQQVFWGSTGETLVDNQWIMYGPSSVPGTLIELPLVQDKVYCIECVSVTDSSGYSFTPDDSKYWWFTWNATNRSHEVYVSGNPRTMIARLYVSSAGYAQVKQGSSGLTIDGATIRLYNPADSAYKPVTVNAIPSEYVVPTGTLSVTSNGTQDVTNYASVNVQVAGETPTYQTKTVTPTESQQTVSPDTGYDALSSVTVNAISSTYVGSGIEQRDETDLTLSGRVFTVPAGYYAEQETKSMELGSITAPTITIDTATGTINASTTCNQSGFVASGTTRNSELAMTTQAATTITPTESEQVAVDTNVYTLGQVKVGAISSTYVGSGIEQRDETDLTVSGATVTVPAGYYAEQETKAVATMTLPTTPASAIDGAEIAFIDRSTSQQFINIPVGYNSTKGGYRIAATPEMTLPTAAAASADGAVKATISRSTANQYINIPAGYNTAKASYVIPATPNGSLAQPTIAVDATTGVITATSRVQGAGYLTSGATTSSTRSLTTQAAATITPSETAQTAVARGKYTLGDVTVAAIPSTYVGSGVDQRDETDLTVSGATVTVPAGYYAEEETASVSTGTAKGKTSVSATSATISAGTNTITLTKTLVDNTPVVTTGYISSPTTTNATVTLTASVGTQAATTYTPGTTNQVIPSKTYLTGAQTILGDADLIAENIKKDVDIFGVTGTYEGTVINNQAKTFTPDETGAEITPDSGYTGLSSVTVAAIPTTYVGSGITQRDETDLTASGATVTVPAGYYAEQETKSVTSGGATGPSSLSGTSATVSTGTNTLTLTKTGVTTTPTVSAGYISGATASTATVTLTASVTTKAAATITPGTSNQTIAAGTYLTGTQTIAGDADLVAGNIKSGVQIFGVTGNLSFITYYTGTSDPSSSLGSDGDIYLKVE